MPIYEYQCEKCCHCFEVLVFRSDDETADCPQCGHSQ
ncbi:MAG: FmdB family zinc ribbon protein, partial [Desulfobacterales bacterium]